MSVLRNFHILLGRLVECIQKTDGQVHHIIIYTLSIVHLVNNCTFLFIFLQGLLLLTQLTKGNANIQKIVAFENAFDRLLEIITEEGASDGGIVVEDCLLLLLNLLKKNSSNQTFFKEGR